MPQTTKLGFVLSTETAKNFKSALTEIKDLQDDGWKIVALEFEEKEQVTVGVVRLELDL